MKNPDANHQLTQRDKIGLGIMGIGALFMYIGVSVEYSDPKPNESAVVTTDRSEDAMLLVSGGTLTAFAGLLSLNCASKLNFKPELQTTSER